MYFRTLKYKKMARISEYQGVNTDKSESIINRILSEIALEPSEIDTFQTRYNISNPQLARLSCHAESQITGWKNGVQIPKRVQIQLALLFAEFKTRFGD